MTARPTILLIHGAGSVGNEWVNFEEGFRRLGYKVVIPTLRLHRLGESCDPSLGNTSLLDYIEDLEALIKSFDQEPVIIGHSMGGLLALILCSKGLGKLGVFITPAAPRGISAFSPSVIKLVFQNLIRWKFWCRPIPPNFSSAFYGVLHDLDRDYAWKVFSKNHSFESGRAIFEICFPFLDKKGATKVDFKKILCPTLIIGSGRDRITPVGISRKLAKKIGADFIEFPEFSHYIMEGKEFEKTYGVCLNWMNKKLDEIKESEKLY